MEAIDNCGRGGSSAGEGGNSDLRASYDAPDGAYAATCDEIGESLELGFDGYMPPGRNWGMLGEHLARDVRLKELLVCDLEVDMVERDFAPVFRGIGANRSLRKLSFVSVEGLFRGRAMGALRPLFSRLECLKIHQCGLGSDGLQVLTPMLTEGGSLTHFELCDDLMSGVPDQAFGELVHALSSHRGRLRTLALRGHRFGTHGCTALRALLRPGTQLVTLDLQGNRFEDEGSFVSLAKSFSRNSTLQDLDLSCNRGVSVNGWATVLSALRSPDCRLEKLSLRSNVIGDRVLNLASVVLSQNNTLKRLDISHAFPCSSAVWETLFNVIRRPSCAVEELVLSGNRFAKDASLALLPVKSLCLSGISFDGWHSFSAALCHSSTERLVLQGNSSLNDRAVGHVTGALVNNSCLRELDLRNCREVSAATWETCLPAVFQSSWSRLEKVDLTGNAINDDTMVFISNSLANNKTLTSLVMNDLFGTITERGLAAISRLLCNSSSAMNAYNSNHTLQSLCEENIEFLLPNRIQELLILNREHGRKEAARLKILRYHFGSSDVIMRTFLDTEKVLPDAIAWMGRDALNGNESRESSGLSLLYQVLPLLLTDGPVIETEQSPKRRRIEA